MGTLQATPGLNMAEQVEKSFQKQPLFQATKAPSHKVAGKTRRWYKDVGLGFKTPREAINGTYIDKKCPWVGNVAIRGRILTGRVVSNKITAPSSSAVNTSTTSPSTTVTRRGTRTSPRTARPPSVSSSATSSPSASAVPFPRPCASTCCASRALARARHSPSSKKERVLLLWCCLATVAHSFP